MYQSDMIDEDDGCGGMQHRPISQQQQRLNVSSQAKPKRQPPPPPPPKPRAPPMLPPQEKSVADDEHQDDDVKVNLEYLFPYLFGQDVEKNDPIVFVGKVLPWRKNSTRTIATGGAQAYYGIYVHEVHIFDGPVIKIKLMALGEWNLSSPETCILCVTNAETETWESVAQEEYEMSKEVKYYPTRFGRAEWHPTVEAKGYFEGTLILKKSFLEESLKQQAMVATLSMCYGATTPWQSEYGVMDLLEFRAGRYHCPRPPARGPIPVETAWRAVFPPAVLERFQNREVNRG